MDYRSIGYINHDDVVNIDDLGIGRLARMYGKAVKQRRADDDRRQTEADWSGYMPHFEVIKERISKELERNADEISGHLPVVSVFDALQEVKAHKNFSRDAGLRALAAHLRKVWDQDREANITANSFLNIKEHYTRSYPKSACIEVFDNMTKKGYFTLPISDLIKIASQVKSQKDFDHLVMVNGLSGKHPHQVKARRFILAVVNGEEEINPETGFSPSEEMDVADWLVKKQQWEGDPEDFRSQFPPPKRRGNEESRLPFNKDKSKRGPGMPGPGKAQKGEEGPLAAPGVSARRKQAVEGTYISNHGDVNWVEHGGLLVFDGSYGPFMYSVEPWGLLTGEIQDIDDPEMTWLVYQIRLDKYFEKDGSLVDEYGHEPWFAKDIDSIVSTYGAEPEEFIKNITSDNPDDLAEAYYMIGGWGGYDEFDNQSYWDAATLRDVFKGVPGVEDLSFDDEDSLAAPGVSARRGSKYAQEQGSSIDPYSFSDFTRAYMEAALWSSNDDSDESGGEPLDSNYDISDISQESLRDAQEDCEKFQRENAKDLEEYYDQVVVTDASSPEAYAGHDFWLTRNGHGAGFWDRGMGDVGDRLSEASEAFGEVNLYVGDDGQIYS